MSVDLALTEFVGDLLAVDDDGDAVADLTVDEAEAITSRIRRWANSFPVEDVVRAFRGRIWVALAYSSWAEWCECELGGLKLPVPQRREIVSELAGAGMSNVAIADTIGVDEGTVRNDRKRSGSENSDPDQKVLGKDGKTYPRPKPPTPQPEPEPEPEIVDAEIVDDPPATKPRRRPLVDTARDIGLDAAKLAGRIENFRADDRLHGKENEVAPKLRHHLEQLIKVCHDLNQQLTQGE